MKGIIFSVLLFFFITISLAGSKFLSSENKIVEEDTDQDEVVTKPIFSLESGFYNVQEVKELTISSKDSIYYTLDSTDPISSETAQIYTGPIKMFDRSVEPNIYSNHQHEDNSPYSITIKGNFQSNKALFDKATVVRAVSKTYKGEFSQIVTKTYFVMDSQKLSSYTEIPIVSIVTNPENLYDKDIGIYVCGQQYIDFKNSADYDQKKNVANFYSKGKEWEREAVFSYFEEGKEIVTQNMGIRIKGGTTRDSPNKSFNLYAKSKYGNKFLNSPIIKNNKDYINKTEIHSYKSFSLRAVSTRARVREYIAQKALKDIIDLAGFYSNKCLLFLEGEFWGLYEISDRVSNDFLEYKYGVPAEGISIIKNGKLEEGSEEDIIEKNDLMNFCKKNSMSLQENYEYIKTKFDIDSFIIYYTVGLYLGTWDWPNQNYFIWKNKGEKIEGNKYSDGKWRFGSFDFDNSIGYNTAYYGGVEGYAFDYFSVLKEKNNFPTCCFSSLAENEEFKKKFAETFEYYIKNVFEPSKMNNIIEEQNNKYLDYITKSAWRWKSDGSDSDLNYFISHQKEIFRKNFEEMKQFFNFRPEYALKDMKNYLGISN